MRTGELLIMETFLKIYLPVYLIAYLITAFVWPSYRTWKQTGNNPVTFGKRDNAHDYIGLLMKLLIAGLFAVVLLHSFAPQWMNYLLPVWYIRHFYVQLCGLVLIHVSLIWIAVAQFQMSNSWRIGIDEQHITPLVTHGVFSVSRNPIFLGLIISMAGIFMILPNALTFLLMTGTYFIIQVQIRLEEEYLQQAHGETYTSYLERTRRLI